MDRLQDAEADFNRLLDAAQRAGALRDDLAAVFNELAGDMATETVMAAARLADNALSVGCDLITAHRLLGRDELERTVRMEHAIRAMIIRSDGIPDQPDD